MQAVYNLLSAYFNRFYEIFAVPLTSTLRCQEELESEVWLCGFDCVLEIILYLASSQAPKSISLHRGQQKGKDFN
jgi:hypothetical protein